MSLVHASDGPAKGATIVWAFKTPPAARDGWVEDLMELSERLEKVRERVSLARQQELKAETQKAQKRRSGSIEWGANKASNIAPAPPSRNQAPRKGLLSMIDELKSVQSSKLESAKKNIV